MAEPSHEFLPPLTSTAGGCNPQIPADMEMIDDKLPQPLQKKNRYSFLATVVEVDSSKGSFEISSMEGNIVWPKHHEKNKKSEVTVLVIGIDGRIRGGPVRSLIAKSPTKVIVSPTNKNVIQNMACKEYQKENEVSIFQFQDQAKRMEEVMDQIYKATLKELNQTN
ncbi:unnamed protein product [Sphenostylis stenocarpa]|uniref:Uncharacterized protein n=1 Tax=Sphenostylis stenocarpa TaxID=92480 RepID=A0AA86VWL8_9FABA|nr:unnamed protein product [Sphenostylis stenocarpa]